MAAASAATARWNSAHGAVLGSTGCQPVVFGSLPKRSFVGKLPTNAGRLLALPSRRERRSREDFSHRVGE